ncbi:hypothetical protein FD17_GL000674 [Lentilactobacillus sunkii DSM 19904]|uniref:Uncharacterized protein n=1 Tax=Lentilactobacillus sunkii DSM 19904 TaxID=1423808 RepID=A0A0R1L550_9LACO|nr:hypothetical protein FD17_GL000674 [Lentilactobacillus sunkii DSM 19904]
MVNKLAENNNWQLMAVRLDGLNFDRTNFNPQKGPQINAETQLALPNNLDDKSTMSVVQVVSTFKLYDDELAKSYFTAKIAGVYQVPGSFTSTDDIQKTIDGDKNLRDSFAQPVVDYLVSTLADLTLKAFGTPTILKREQLIDTLFGAKQ